MNKLLIIGCIILMILTPVASACNDCICNPDVNVNNILTQIMYLTVQQSQHQYQAQYQLQQQQQQQTMNAATVTGWGDSDSQSGNKLGIIQEGKTYSRLLYPQEVLAFPLESGDTCYLYSGLPVAFYTINAGNGTFRDQVQTSESSPTYDPVYHRMEFGRTPVVDKIDYWTMKAKLVASPEANYCVIDNRAEFSTYTTIEVTIQG